VVQVFATFSSHLCGGFVAAPGLPRWHLDSLPVEAAFGAENLAKLPYGMHDILGNAMHWDHSPDLVELSQGLSALSRSGLLARSGNSPMLVINGADDYFIPRSDTLTFDRRTDTEVHLIPDTGHVAMSKAAEVVPMIVGWLRNHLS
jgi:esterase FrsA